MRVSRRFVMQGLGASVAASRLIRPSPVFAQMTLGDATLTSISDGNLTLPKAMIFDTIPAADYEPILQSFGITGESLTPPCNVTLLQAGDRSVLFDVGSGPEFMASAGLLADGLADLGVDPAAITDVVFTHAHPDHLWGLFDDFGDLVFPNARYMIGQAEWDYWTDPNTVDTIGEARTTFAVGAARRLGDIADQITFINDGAEILPGVAARATFGHTPGHMSFEVRSGTSAAMIIGDAIGNHHVAFERPDWFAGTDQDQTIGAATRVKLLDQLASEQIKVIGFHLLGNGIGQVERKDGGFRFVPDAV